MFGSHLVEGSFVEALDQNEMLGCLDTANFQRTVAKIHRGWHTYLKKILIVCWSGWAYDRKIYSKFNLGCWREYFPNWSDSFPSESHWHIWKCCKWPKKGSESGRFHFWMNLWLCSKCQLSIYRGKQKMQQRSRRVVLNSKAL